MAHENVLAFVENTNVVELREHTNSISGATIVDATVTVTITDEEGVEVAGETWPASMPHVSAGLYRYVVPHDLPFEAGKQYTAHVLASSPGPVVFKSATLFKPFIRRGRTAKS